MKQMRILLLSAVIAPALVQAGNSAAVASTPQAQPSQQQPAARAVDLKASDGTLLKASYFAAAKPGPGVLLFHQTNRTRKAWDDVALQLAAAGINTLTLDMRGFGESGGIPHDKLTPKERAQVRERRPADIDTAWQFCFRSQASREMSSAWADLESMASRILSRQRADIPHK
jgi:alpha-beta hydrolase superfamily lysophospholipase